MKRLKARIELFDKHISEIEEELEGYSKKDKQLDARVSRITTIPGVGKMTAMVVLAETNGFELIRNKKTAGQLCGTGCKRETVGHLYQRQAEDL